MLLIIHIALGLASIVITVLAFLKPSKTKIQTSTVLGALTLASGIGLIFLDPANWTRICLSGGVYLILVAAGIIAANQKLAARIQISSK